MKNILKYYFKKRWILLVILTIASSLICFVSITNSLFIYNVTDEYGTTIQLAANVPTPTITLIACILATIIPIYEFYFKMRKVNVDQMYSLPIKRDKLFMSTLLFCLIELIIPITFNYLLMLLIIVSKENMFNMAYFLPYYFILIILCSSILCIVAFIYTRNNTMIDGIINVIFVILLGWIIMLALKDVFRSAPHDSVLGQILYPSLYTLYSPMYEINMWFKEFLENDSTIHDFFKNNFTTSHDRKLTLLILSFIQIVLGAFSVFGLKHYASIDKAEDSMQKSTSSFSYKVMIPIFAISLFVFARDQIITITLIMTVCVFIMYCIYHRTIKLKGKQILIMGIVLSVGFILALFCETYLEDAVSNYFDPDNQIDFYSLFLSINTCIK